MQQATATLDLYSLAFALGQWAHSFYRSPSFSSFLNFIGRVLGLVAGSLCLILHNHALSTAPGVIAWFAHVHFAFWGTGTESARPGGVGGHFLVVSADFTDEVVEGVFNVDARLRGGFDEFAAELSREGLSL